MRIAGRHGICLTFEIVDQQEGTRLLHSPERVWHGRLDRPAVAPDGIEIKGWNCSRTMANSSSPTRILVREFTRHEPAPRCQEDTEQSVLDHPDPRDQLACLEGPRPY